MKIFLLTHEKEFKRHSNTGNVVARVLGPMAEQLLWQRKNPSKTILETIDCNDTVLLFNNSEDNCISDISHFENFIILDGTWQEAGKIYNKSPYLKEMKSFTFKTCNKSQYNLRRNQKEWGLCTAECVIEILKMKGDNKNAEKIHDAFLLFIDSMN
ncbi:MAG: DTW domain-containing protein [Spirochaetaceae bacterium]|nr:DTW domain-containing protein [Spirochaetaceae bacterium]